jgi:hypothetical protein
MGKVTYRVLKKPKNKIKKIYIYRNELGRCTSTRFRLDSGEKKTQKAEAAEAIIE